MTRGRTRQGARNRMQMEETMEFTRRDVCALGAGLTAAAALAGMAGPALADAAATDAAVAEFTGGAATSDAGIDLIAPEIAENGNTVPIEVSGAAGVVSVMILASGNPNPGVATFHFGELAGSRAASTRIRLAKTQDVIAVAKMEDGSFAKTSRTIKVTIGGCGG
jgi:sulfur-oxidizing protein SoxY